MSNLHFDCYFQGDSTQWENAPLLLPPIVIVPGLFGSSVNWRSFAKPLSLTHVVLVIDQRNHGQSPHAETHTYEDMVADLYDFLQKKAIEEVILCGHSMGGKTAMLFSQCYPNIVSALIVLDIAPVCYRHHPAPFLSALVNIDVSAFSSRKEIEQSLRDIIPDQATRLFIMMSLIGSAGDFSWKINLNTLHTYIDEIINYPVLAKALPYEGKSLFVGGQDSHYMQVDYHPLIQAYFTHAVIHYIAGAGHWLHVQKPKEVIVKIQQFLQ